jgi:predicted MFS family arabinose efflux permease
MNTIRNRSYIMPVLVGAQFAGTSLWFAGNAVLPGLQQDLGLQANALGHITSAVQLGFITGTLLFALLTIADRFSPSKVFLASSIAGAIANSSILYLASDLGSVLILRFATGFFLAGIYPVGMKIASDWHEKGLGKALGYLVGALVVGTAFPHLLRTFTDLIPWRSVIVFTSLFAAAGGLLVWLFISNGPFRRKSAGLDVRAAFRVFANKDFKAASFGYFGHMWELYTFWAFVPVLLFSHRALSAEAGHTVSFLSFLIIAIGGLSCIIGGYLSQKWGSSKVAFTALFISGACCLLSPLLLLLPFNIFLLFLLIWGAAATADSPQFSTLVAQTAPKDAIGTALTMVTCIGFAITIFSIQLISTLHAAGAGIYMYSVLAIGPILGLLSMWRLARQKAPAPTPPLSKPAP